MDIDSVNPLSQLAGSAAMQAGSIDDLLKTTTASAVNASDQKKEQIAKQFESVFIGKLFDQIRESVGSLSLDEEEEGISDQVQGLFWMYLAQDVGEKGGFGMWKDIYQQLREMDGGAPAGGQISEEL
jgi:Rod binding domain-containing protein